MCLFIHCYALHAVIAEDCRLKFCMPLWNAEQLISGKEDAANNFARGHYTIGKVVPVDTSVLHIPHKFTIGFTYMQ